MPITLPAIRPQYLNYSKSLIGEVAFATANELQCTALSANYDDDNVESVKTFYKMAKKAHTLHRMDFNALSMKSIPSFKGDFMFY